MQKTNEHDHAIFYYDPKAVISYADAIIVVTAL